MAERSTLNNEELVNLTRSDGGDVEISGSDVSDAAGDDDGDDFQIWCCRRRRWM